MDSTALATFLAIQEAGGVTPAAERLGRTQSAISHRLSALEAEIGAPLFARIGHRLVLNEVGTVLLPYAKQMSAMSIDALAATQAAITGESGTLKLAIVGTLASTPLPMLRAFRDQFPECDLRVQTARSAEVSDLVRKGEVAIGVRYFEDTDRGVESVIVGREPLVVVCAPSHPNAGQSLSSLTELANERWLTFPDHADRLDPFSGTIFAQFLLRGISTFDTVSIDSMTAQKRMAEAGFGIALIQESAIQEEVGRGDLCRIIVQDLNAHMAIASVIRKNGYLSEAGRWLLGEMSSAPWSASAPNPD